MRGAHSPQYRVNDNCFEIGLTELKYSIYGHFLFTNTNVMYAQKGHFKIDVFLITVFPMQHAV